MGEDRVVAGERSDATPEAQWRVGRKVGRTIYEQRGPEPSDADELIGVMDTAALAAMAVQAVNTHALDARSGADTVKLAEVRRLVRDTITSFDGNWDEYELADMVDSALASLASGADTVNSGQWCTFHAMRQDDPAHPYDYRVCERCLVDAPPELAHAVDELLVAYDRSGLTELGWFAPHMEKVRQAFDSASGADRPEGSQA